MSFSAGAGIAIFLAVSSVCFAFDGESSLQERLRTEAPEAWAALAENLLHSEGDGTGTESTTDSSGKTVESKTTRISFRLAGPAVRIEATGAETGNQAVFCMNSRYAFQLNRNAEADPFVIRSTRPRTREDGSTAKFGIAGF